MELSNGKQLREGEIVYLRARVVGFGPDPALGHCAALAPCDERGNWDESGTVWYVRPDAPSVCKSAVVAGDIEAKARAMMEKMK